MLIYKAKQFMMTKKNPRNVYIFKKTVQVFASRWYWTSNCLKFVQNIMNYIELMAFFCDDDLKYIKN
jgi:hypothetical protein